MLVFMNSADRIWNRTTTRPDGLGPSFISYTTVFYNNMLSSFIGSNESGTVAPLYLYVALRTNKVEALLFNLNFMMLA